MYKVPSQVVLFFIFVYMRLPNYISDLLYRYECVIVPEFGGFVTNEISARVNNFTHTFYPPTKQLSFNSYLKNNDGLLANYISSVENISFSDATNIIKEEVNNWNQSLKNESIEIPKIGSLTLNGDRKIIFEPSQTENYLTSSFGLNSFNSAAIKRTEYLEKVRSIETTTPLVPVSNKKTPVFLKYAASAAILFAVGSFVWNTYNENQYQQQLLAEQQQQETINKKIQEATFVIDNPLPTITLNVTKEIKNYHIVAGAFREVANADKKVAELISKGFDAQILGVNKWGLTQVSYASFNSKRDAINKLRVIKKQESSDAWLLVQEF